MNINDYLLNFTKYDLVNTSNNNDNNNESIELNEDENDNNNILNGRWSQKEHLLFIKGCLLYGNNWKKVKKYIQTRSCSQIRSHAQKYLNKINKKYNGNKNNGNNLDLNIKLSEEDISKLVSKNKFSDKDMDDAELYILSIFKVNKEKEKSLIEDNDEKEAENLKNGLNNYKRKNANEVEKIFNIVKVSKEQKEKLMEENNKESNDNYDEGGTNNLNEMDNMDLDGNGNNADYAYENNSIENNKNNRKINSKNNRINKSKQKKILKENILAEKVDMNSFSRNEIFINQCLDSKDPKDLVKLLTHFGNDINFKVNDIKILKKYQDYLGLEIDNSEDNNYNNSNNKEINEIYPISDDSINNQNQNNIYPYIFNPSNNSFQFNPLCNSKLLINPSFMNQY
jgi:SHAQKYF class myb-like DNA-binding protein